MRDKATEVARIAVRQHGVVTAAQLLAAGFTRAAISRWVASGRLHRVHRGVYAVGHAGLSLHGRYLAAVLACGEGAVLSHDAAAHLLRLTAGAAPPPHVTTPGEHRRDVAGVWTHHTRRLDPRETSVLDAVPVTTVPRTLLDLAAGLSVADLARACHNAHVHHRTTAALVEATIARNPNRAGTRRLRAALGTDLRLTLSETEDEFLRVLGEAALPLPRTNRRRGRDRVDCHWPAHGVTVELDSFRFHATRHAYEEDVRRERRARRAGDVHLRFTWGDVFEQPAAMLAELRPVLGT